MNAHTGRRDRKDRKEGRRERERKGGKGRERERETKRKHTLKHKPCLMCDLLMDNTRGRETHIEAQTFSSCVIHSWTNRKKKCSFLINYVKTKEIECFDVSDECNKTQQQQQ